MLAVAFRSLGIHLSIGFLVLAATGSVLWWVYGPDYAVRFLEITVRDMKGPWVWTFGYGLMSFIRSAGRTPALELTTILEPNETVLRAVAIIDLSVRHRQAFWIALPVTLVGAFLTLVYRVPHVGPSFWIISVLVVSIYYVAAYILAHFLGMLRAFHSLYTRIEDVRFNPTASPLHLENMMDYLAISTTLGVVAIYAGFRGTVTAGFEFESSVWEVFLITPLVLFLPATLFYNYYPRYVLRRALQYRIFSTMNRLGTASGEDSRGLLIDLREAGSLNGQILPFLDYRSLPSYIVAILFVLSLAYSHDPAIRGFVTGLLGTTVGPGP